MVQRILIVFGCILIHLSGNAQRLERMLLENWMNERWENSMEQTYAYTSDNQLSTTLIKHWSLEKNDWMNHSKTRLHRDLNGHVVRKETETWDAKSSEWKPSQSINYTLDLSGNAIVVVTSVFKDGEWKNAQNELSEYDSENHLTSKLTQKWNEKNGEWQNDRKYEYEFVEVQKWFYTIYYWNNTVNDWENYKEVGYTFSSDDQIESRLDYSWMDGNWFLSSVQIYELDSVNNVTAINVEKFNQEREAFELTNRVEYRLNDYRKIDESLTKNMINGQLTNLQRSTYSYSQQNDVSEYSGFDGQLELFPNPTARFIHLSPLKKGQITIFDETGREVMRIENNEQEGLTIDVSSWEAGNYTIQLSNGEVQKFMKK